MAEIKTFRAFHYNPQSFKDLPVLVCPPYDVISAEEQKRLQRQHPKNFVRMELPAGAGGKEYQQAARLWKDWLARDVVERDPAPAFYLYKTVFASQITGRLLSRRGFLAALRVRSWGNGIYPHEKTLPAPKADRMKLFQTLRVQTSPLQCLFDDSSGQAAHLLEKPTRAEPWIDFTDPAKIRHRIWRLGEGALTDALRRILARAAVVMADGHHRYETARAYGAWARAKWGAHSPASQHVLAYFSPSSDPGLEVLPTHRVVGRNKRRFVQLERWGTLKPVSGWNALASLCRRRPAMFVGVFWDGRFYQYRFTSAPPRLKGTPLETLGVACLHAGPLEGLGKEDFFFTRDPQEAVRWSRRKKGWAFFLAPSAVRDVIAVATSGLVMPPKSTYFYPKLPSGLLSHSLQGEL